jgi:hypothetical protein
VMALVMSVPGAIGLISPALADEHTHAQRPERAVV